MTASTRQTSKGLGRSTSAIHRHAGTAISFGSLAAWTADGPFRRVCDRRGESSLPAIAGRQPYFVVPHSGCFEMIRRAAGSLSETATTRVGGRGQFGNRSISCRLRDAEQLQSWWHVFVVLDIHSWHHAGVACAPTPQVEAPDINIGMDSEAPTALSGAGAIVLRQPAGRRLMWPQNHLSCCFVAAIVRGSPRGTSGPVLISALRRY